MKCQNCGAEINNIDVKFCSVCGTALIVEKSEGSVEEFKSYFIHSILVLIFCCVPFGIVALINSTKAKSQYEIGNYREAEESARQAKKWCIISAVGGLIFSIIYAFFIIMVN